MKCNVEVFYLARFAPNENGRFPLYDGFNVNAEYHRDIYNVLKDECDSLRTSNDPSSIFDLPEEVRYIFSLFNRMPIRSSEVFVSSVAEYKKIAYLGAPPNIRAVAEDKHLGKMMAKHAGVLTPEWETYSLGDAINPPCFEGPFFIKPRFGAASKHVSEDSLCHDWLKAKKQIEYLLSMKVEVLVEKYIDGVYHTSPILSNYGSPKALPCIEQKSDIAGNIVTWEQKRNTAGGLVRTVLEDGLLNSKMQEHSLSMYRLVQPLDYTRFDYMVTSEGDTYFLEFNVCCNLGKHSTISQSALFLGYDYETLVKNIFYSSLHRWGLVEEMSYQF
jgi:D-alanine-D-alanine ligase